MTTKPKTGVSEWAPYRCNCQNGCSHRCRYCYAATDALRYGRIKSLDEWGTEYHHIREKDVRKGRKKDSYRAVLLRHGIEV